MTSKKLMTLEELYNAQYPEEVKTFILAYSLKLQIERLKCYGMKGENYLGVLVLTYDGIVTLLDKTDSEIKTAVKIRETVKDSCIIELKSKGVEHGRGILGIVNSKQLKYLKDNYGVNKTMIVYKGYINKMLLKNFDMMNDLL